MKLTYLLLGLLMGAVENPTVFAQVTDVQPDAFMHSTQMIVVTTSNWDAVDGQLQRYVRGTEREIWREKGAPISIVVGKNGMGWGIGVVTTDAPGVHSASAPIKKEGDGKSPAGVFALGKSFPDTPSHAPCTGLKLEYVNLTPSIECVDDVGSKYYNRMIDRSTVSPDWNSSERMRSVGDAYTWGIVVDHNGIVAQVNDNPPIPGGGSCIFLHIWAGSRPRHSRMYGYAAKRPQKPC